MTAATTRELTPGPLPRPLALEVPGSRGSHDRQRIAAALIAGADTDETAVVDGDGDLDLRYAARGDRQGVHDERADGPSIIILTHLKELDP